MQIVVLDSGALGADIDLSPIRNIGVVTEYTASAPSTVPGRIANADVVILNKVKLGRDELASAERLRLICIAATGYDNVDTAYCRARGITVCNVPGYSTDNVAQLTAAMALSLVTHLFEYRDFVCSGSYSSSSAANRLEPVYHEIAGLTWGVVGGGAIGSKVAMLANAFGCRVLLCRRKPEELFEAASIDRICRECDIISLHVPLTEETRGMISRERIASMKDGVIMINTSRGAVCDEAALADGVLSGKLGGLGCDVYSKEPFTEEHPMHRLLKCPNVCLTPHMAWGSYEARQRCIRIIAENITDFTNGIIKNGVN